MMSPTEIKEQQREKIERHIERTAEKRMISYFEKAFSNEYYARARVILDMYKQRFGSGLLELSSFCAAAYEPFMRFLENGQKGGERIALLLKVFPDLHFDGWVSDALIPEIKRYLNELGLDT
jgi:hypothetical protein